MPDRRKKPQVETGPRAAKTCVSCGRSITWRKRWERTWDEVRFCSDGCRAHRPGTHEAALEAAILRLLAGRGAGKTICPSEAARAVAGDEERAAWEPLMEPVRAAARRLAAAGTITVLQGGVAVDPSTAKGPIRLKLGSA